MIKKLLLSLTIIISHLSHAQQNKNWCESKVPSLEWDNIFNTLVEKYKTNLKATNTTSVSNYIIPVIVHVIHSGQSIGTWPNISQAQINSQIIVLNDDYSANGAGVSQYNNIFYNGHGPFYDYAQANSLPSPNNTNLGIIVSNTGIQFCMALVDPNGNILSEPGIDRVNCVSKGFSNPTTIASSNFNNYLDNTLKPSVIWDNTKYMNVYVSDRPVSSGLLGYTTFPAISTLTGITTGVGTTIDDGIWIYGKSFGTTGALVLGYTGGQVCGHESGHYFGLRHPWGDGMCLTDYCNDTPPAYQANYNSNSLIQYPYINSAGSCTGNFGNGETYMNLMDYSLDVSKFMFTYDQTIRMQTAMQNSPYRKLLGTHSLCASNTATGMINQFIKNDINIFPNPSNGYFNIKTNFHQRIDLYIELYNALGELMYTQTEKNISNSTIELHYLNETKGLYFINIHTSSNEYIRHKIILE